LGNIRNHYYRGIERLRSYVFPLLSKIAGGVLYRG
jgi:hypothetical protein